MWTDQTGLDVSGIYSRGYFQGEAPDGYFDYLGSEKLLAAEYRGRLDFIRNYKKQGKLLEIGCATGGFLLEASSFFSVQGLDVSGFAAQQAVAKGLDVECAPLEKSAHLCPPYDVIVLFDTLEHLSNPAASLRQLFALLNRDGYVFITTGDTQSLLARLAGKNWRLMTPPQHLWFFSRRNLALLLRNLDFEVVCTRHLARRVPLSLMWYQLFRGSREPLPTKLGRITLRANLFDVMTVVARKP